MNAKLAELARRREALISRSAAQRQQLLQTYHELEKPIGFVKGVVSVIETVRHHPAVAIGLTALLLSGRLGKSNELSKRLGMGWRILRLLQIWRSKPQA